MHHTSAYLVINIFRFRSPLVYCLLALEVGCCIGLTTDPVRSRKPLSKDHAFDDGSSTRGKLRHSTAIAVAPGGMLGLAASQDESNEAGQTESSVRRVPSIDGTGREPNAELNTSREAPVAHLKRDDNDGSTPNVLRATHRAPSKQVSTRATVLGGGLGGTFLDLVLLLVALVSLICFWSLVAALYTTRGTGQSLTQSWHTMFGPLMGESERMTSLRTSSLAVRRGSGLTSVKLNRSSVDDARRQAFVRPSSPGSPTETSRRSARRGSSPGDPASTHSIAAALTKTLESSRSASPHHRPAHTRTRTGVSAGLLDSADAAGGRESRRFSHRVTTGRQPREVKDPMTILET